MIGGDIMNLSIINESVLESCESVYDIMDSVYIKQQEILEYSNDIGSVLDSYKIFQEGFSKPGSSKELNVWNFENKHILKAIKCFNKAYKRIEIDRDKLNEEKIKQERGKLNIVDSLAPGENLSKNILLTIEENFKKSDGYFEEGFQELQKQFDCKFKIYVSRKTGLGTLISKFPDEPGKLTISKSKGFQLGGLLISININVKQLMCAVPANEKLFGQSFVSILLHEIYHNIVHMMDVRNKKLHNDIVDTVGSLSKAKNFISSTSIVSTFVTKFKSMFNLKDPDIKDKDRIENRLYVLSRIKDNPAAMKKFQKDISQNKDETENERELDNYIEKLSMMKGIIKAGKISGIVGTTCVILLTAIGFVASSVPLMVGGGICLAIMALGLLKKKVSSLFGVKIGIQEEYFCDLFASMYKLPIHITSFNRQIQLNKTNSKKVASIRETEQSIDKYTKDIHPMDFDRELTSYRTAKQILESGQKLKKPIRDYLEYIVNLHDGIEDIERSPDKRQQKKLDPESAKDLQKVLNDFVNKTGVTVTESFIMEFINGGVIDGT